MLIKASDKEISAHKWAQQGFGKDMMTENGDVTRGNLTTMVC